MAGISPWRPAYLTDLSDAEFAYLEPLLPPPRSLGRPRVHPPREILNAIFTYCGVAAPGGCRRTSSRPGRPPTITFDSGAWTVPGRMSTLSFASNSERALGVT